MRYLASLLLIGILNSCYVVAGAGALIILTDEDNPEPDRALQALCYSALVKNNECYNNSYTGDGCNDAYMQCTILCNLHSGNIENTFPAMMCGM